MWCGGSLSGFTHPPQEADHGPCLLGAQVLRDGHHPAVHVPQRGADFRIRCHRGNDHQRAPVRGVGLAADMAAAHEPVDQRGGGGRGNSQDAAEVLGPDPITAAWARSRYLNASRSVSPIPMESRVERRRATSTLRYSRRAWRTAPGGSSPSSGPYQYPEPEGLCRVHPAILAELITSPFRGFPRGGDRVQRSPESCAKSMPSPLRDRPCRRVLDPSARNPGTLSAQDAGGFPTLRCKEWALWGSNPRPTD